jgi:hypothetical protein
VTGLPAGVVSSQPEGELPVSVQLMSRPDTMGEMLAALAVLDATSEHAPPSAERGGTDPLPLMELLEPARPSRDTGSLP